MFQVITRARVPVVGLLSPRAGVLVVGVRGRKSRLDPKAKSKEGRIKYPPPVDPVEMVVMKERFTEYGLIMRALRSEFKEEVLRKKYQESVGSQAEERSRQEAEEHHSLMAMNEAENIRIRKLRELRVQKEAQAAELKKQEEIFLQEKLMQDFVAQKQKEILRLEEDVKHFITMENVDQRIEEALDNPHNYNFAIDKEGRVVKRTVLL